MFLPLSLHLNVLPLSLSLYLNVFCRCPVKQIYFISHLTIFLLTSLTVNLTNSVKLVHSVKIVIAYYILPRSNSRLPFFWSQAESLPPLVTWSNREVSQQGSFLFPSRMRDTACTITINHCRLSPSLRSSLLESCDVSRDLQARSTGRSLSAILITYEQGQTMNINRAFHCVFLSLQALPSVCTRRHGLSIYFATYKPEFSVLGQT